MAVSGLMHICHASRSGVADGHGGVTGASTNVCGRPCCYLYRRATQTRKYLQKTDRGPFLFRVKVVTVRNRWDERVRAPLHLKGETVLFCRGSAFLVHKQDPPLCIFGIKVSFFFSAFRHWKHFFFFFSPQRQLSAT